MFSSFCTWLPQKHEKQIAEPSESNVKYADFLDVFDFLYINADFFSAQFVDPLAYKLWAASQKDHLTPFAEEVGEVFRNYMMVSEFRRALCGGENNREGTLLNDDNYEKMGSFLDARPAVINVMKRHIGNPSVDEWYKTQASVGQCYRREQKQRQSASTRINYKLCAQIEEALQLYKQDPMVSKLIKDLNDIGIIGDTAVYQAAVTNRLMQFKEDCQSSSLRKSPFANRLGMFFKSHPSKAAAAENVLSVINQYTAWAQPKRTPFTRPE
jgi:hypothetical protein